MVPHPLSQLGCQMPGRVLGSADRVVSSRALSPYSCEVSAFGGNSMCVRKLEWLEWREGG